LFSLEIGVKERRGRESFGEEGGAPRKGAHQAIERGRTKAKYEFKKRNIKAKRTILNAVKDHIISHVSGKDFAFQTWQSLCSLY
jgi:hypothetical protein